MLKQPISPALLLRALFALTALTPLSAVAQQRDPAAAQALFDQARTLTQKGQYAEACPKLLESNRLDPGIGTLFHLADCYEKSGQIATAWATFLDVASLARSTNQMDREKVATKRANLLEGRLPRLTVNVPAANHVDGLVIHRDEVQIGTAQWGVLVPVDPGEHELVVSAPGRKSFTQRLKLEASKTTSFDVPLLEKEATTPIAVLPPTPAVPKPMPEPAPIPGPRHAATGSVSALPIVLAGASVVGFGVGAVFGLKAKATNKDSKAHCDTDNSNLCDPEGVSQRNDARSQGNIATVGFVAGGALLAAAVVVWRVEVGSSKKSGSSASHLHAGASILPGSAALYLQGGF